MDKKNPKAIIFDIDDTLIQTIQTIWNKYKYIGKHYYNIEVTDDDIQPHWGKRINEVAYESLRRIDKPETIYQITLNESKNFVIPEIEGASKTIEKLSNKYFIAAVTSSSREFIINDLINAGFNIELFEFIQTSDDTEFIKPDPRVFDPTLDTLNKVGITNSETVYVGDSIKDFIASKKVGFTFMAVLTGLTTKEEFINVGMSEENIFENISDVGNKLLK